MTRRGSGSRRGPACTSVTAALLLVASGAATAAGAIAPCMPGSGDHCGFSRPEDLAPADDDGRWLLVSQASPVEPLLLLDTASGHRSAVPLPAAGAPVEPVYAGRRGDAASRCPGAPARIEAAGNDVRRVAGHRLAAVLNRAAPARVELFAVVQRRGSAPTLRWRDCILLPAGTAANDVALAPRDAVYVSQMFDPPRDATAAAALRARFQAAEPTGRALRWSAAGGWTAVAGTGLSFANGIAVSGDGRWLAVAGTFDQALLLLPRTRSGEAAAGLRRIALGLQPDNLSRVGAAGFVVAGHTGTPVSGIDPCRSLRDVPCGFPFAVAQVDAVGGVVEPLLEDDGRATPGASVAVVVGPRLYLGSAFGDRVALRHTGAAPHGKASHESR